MEQITARGFQGLDIDFEYILAEDRDAFVDFVAYMQEAVSALGYPTSVALAPKTSDTQTGLLYEGKDYRETGRDCGLCPFNDLRVGLHLWASHGGSPA